jgi:hypothetical protein
MKIIIAHQSPFHMLRMPLILTVPLMLAGVAFAQKVQTNYDKSLDFSKFHTYAWREHLVGSSTGAVARRLILGLYPGFPPSCPCRTCRGPVSSARHIARSVRISRTTRSCTVRRKAYETCRSAFALRYSLRLRSCRLIGAFIISPCLPC